jgi:hypothetical protein
MNNYQHYRRTPPQPQYGLGSHGHPQPPPLQHDNDIPTAESRGTRRLPTFGITTKLVTGMAVLTLVALYITVDLNNKASRKLDAHLGNVHLSHLPPSFPSNSNHSNFHPDAVTASVAADDEVSNSNSQSHQSSTADQTNVIVSMFQKLKTQMDRIENRLDRFETRLEKVEQAIIKPPDDEEEVTTSNAKKGKVNDMAVTHLPLLLSTPSNHLSNEQMAHQLGTTNDSVVMRQGPRFDVHLPPPVSLPYAKTTC